MSNEKTESNNEPKSLTQEEAYEMAGIFARLQYLQTAPPDVAILRPDGDTARTPNAQQLTRDVEMQVLIERLMQNFLMHGSELLGTWFAMQTEYTPLVRALAPIVKRCVAMPEPQAPLLPDSMRPNTEAKGGDNV